MELTEVERLILARIAEKTRMAGGPRPGFNLRKRAISYFADLHPGLDFDQGLAGLVDKGLLKPNENGSRFVLTAAGATELETLVGARD